MKKISVLGLGLLFGILAHAQQKNLKELPPPPPPPPVIEKLSIEAPDSPAKTKAPLPPPIVEKATPPNPNTPAVEPGAPPPPPPPPPPKVYKKKRIA